MRELEDQPLSLLILKPESRAACLSRKEKAIIRQVLGRHTAGRILASAELTLTERQARVMWGNVASFEWADDYYAGMTSGPIEAHLLLGSPGASVVKREVRRDLTPMILKLKSELAVPYLPDIVHGSDEGEVERELAIIGLLEIASRLDGRR